MDSTNYALVLTGCFILAKWFGWFSESWWWVFSPILIPILLVILLVILSLVALGIVSIFHRI